MNDRTFPALAVAGVGGALIWHFTGNRYNQGGIPVSAGLPDWDPAQAEQNPDVFVGLDGRRHRIGSIGAVNAAYELAAECSYTLTRYTQLADRALMLDPARYESIYKGFSTIGRYSVAAHATEYERLLLSQMLRAALGLGYSLRLLASAYEAAHATIDYRPAVWSRRGVDLRNIACGSLLNPMADHAADGSGLASRYKVYTIRRHEQWAVFGVSLINAWISAYLDISRIDGFQNYLDTIQDELHPPAEVMGIAWAPLVWGAGKALALVVGTYLAYRVVLVFGSALSQFLGHNVNWLNAMDEAHQEALDCAYDATRSPDERSDCLDEAKRIQESIRGYKTPMSAIVRYGAIAALGVGGWVIVSRERKRK